MTLLECVDTWFFENGPKESSLRRVRYEVASWIRRGGPAISESISESDCVAWRRAATETGLAPRTVESVIATVCLLCRVGGNPVASGKRLHRLVKIRHTPTLGDLNAVIYEADSSRWRSGNWWRTALCLAYSTGLRLADLERFDRDMVDGDCVLLRAEKTGKEHRIPLPELLRDRLDGFRWSISRKVLRRELNRLCDVAGVPRFTPQGIRRLSATEWERARPGCGPVILGHDIPGWSRATLSYLDKSLLLRLGLPAMRLPAWIDDGRAADRESSLLTSFRRLGEPQQSALVAVASGMH